MKPFLDIPLFITCPWGPRNHPIDNIKHFHNGVDLRAKYETITAPENGTIAYVGSNPRSGKYLGLLVSTGNVIEFVHLSDTFYSKGDVIKEGWPIAITGNSGYSTAPHLHFAIKRPGSDVKIDPTSYVKKLWTVETLVTIGVPFVIVIGILIYIGTT